MLEAAMTLVDAYRLGDLASLVGLVVALVGFAVTIRAAWRARTAAETAAKAAEAAREQMASVRSTTTLAGVISRLDGLKLMHRRAKSVADWRDMPDRYSAIRTELVHIRGRYPSPHADEKRIIQASIEALRALEDLVERAIQAGALPDDVPGMNRVVAQRVDELSELSNRLQAQLETRKRDD